MSAANKIVLTTPMILEAHAAHGNDFIVIDFESTRKFKNFAQYINIDVRLVDDKVVNVRYWKISNDGIVVASRISNPEQRKYESIRMGVALKDEEGVENDNAKALYLLCTAFEAKMNDFKRDGVITDDARAPRKQADGTFRPFHLISTKIVTPMQTTAKSKETGDIIDLENPFFWISIGKKKFYGAGEIAKPSIHFDDKYYADENGQPDVERPVMTHEYEPSFFNIDDFYHHPRTGKKIYKQLGAVNPDTEETVLDNTNIQDYLTKGSAMMGNFKFELAVSGRQCKLDVKLYGRFYVKVAETEIGAGGQDDEDEIEAFGSNYAKLSNKPKTAADEEEEFFDDED